jgi:hypothetical protein
MAKDALLVLNDLLKNNVVSSELLPDIISRYSELKASFEKNPYGEALKQVMNSVDRSFMSVEEMVPSSQILLLGVAINLVKMEKAQQSQKIDFFSFLPNTGMKKCSKCNILNIQNARFCSSCGEQL